ncbi:M24 family metallopeptidase [Lysinibacillus odysseyi]|uniref:Metallopeptidase n=1 Tax=Lysinibacillus odysseyi 34hs-1 = NBRC 100172 TaxID=1220589 RepID=A0A0A3IK96_9BACI|nr:Xaa-Pro peptidase family protein [Lysinibacillus odysseyi]KGR83233.1 metallopeptidase [Lysinibacillus odysseyi 34hs-1 = NBRC 100172]
MTKLQQLQGFLKEKHIDAALITMPDNVFYFSGFLSEPHERLLGVMVFQEAEPFLICPQMEVPDAVAAGWSFETIGHLDTENAWDKVAQAVAKRSITMRSLAIEKSHLTVERLEELAAHYPDARFERLDDQINAMRVIKSSEELEKMRKAAELADYAVQVGCEALTEGKTELEVLNEIESAVKAKGYSMSFDTMVLAGEKSASPHGVPGNRKIKRGDMVLFDLGVIYEGYCSDITRTVAFGEINEAQRAIYDAVLKANEDAIAAVKPGVRAMDLDKIARDTIADAGYGDYFPHRLGHGLGISVHEFPSITGVNELPMEEGMVFTIEPGIYKADVTGVRIEDDVVVTKDGVEILTKFPKELMVIQR